MKHNSNKHINHNSQDHEEHSHHAHHDKQIENGRYEEDEHQSHDHDSGAHEHQHHGDFKVIFFKSLPFGIVIMILSPMMGITLPLQFTFPYSDVLVTVLSTFLLIYGGRPFFQGALDEFRKKEPGMMALISLGLSVSYFYSVYAVIFHYVTGAHVMEFFFEFASLLLIMLLGHWIEMRAVGKAGDAQRSLAELLPKDAQVVIDNDKVETRAVSKLEVGDIVRVQAGENIPADGIIEKGNSRVNEALLTGESKPIQKTTGDEAIGGSTNGDGILFVKIMETGDKSFISQVQDLISQAQSQPSRAESIAQRVAGLLFYIALFVAFIAFFIWLFLVDLQTAVIFTVTTLVIACPHALGLAIPLVTARSTSLGAGRGLLVKDREALELAVKSDIMILDKTGTLTTGEFKVLDVKLLDERYSKEEVLALLAGIESGSSHPIAQSIIGYVKEKGISQKSFDTIEVVSGSGVEGEVNKHHYQLLSQKAYGKKLDIHSPKGATISVLIEDGKPIGAVLLGDELKKTSKDLITALKSKGIQPLMATGDNETAAQGVAEELGIDYRANQSPQDKYDLVEFMKNKGKTVIMVGDGVNDAPSLSLADVGVAVGAGTQVALDSADVVLTQSDPGDIESFIELAHKTTRKMKQNLVWGAGYNFIAIPIAAGVLVPIGISLTPAVGAMLMSLSTVIVAVNAMFLKLDDAETSGK
ncbi:heavy metal translocating P-type ATPase [Alkalibacterium sp.]|nr:MAG: cadmium-translocating P-type ATPase [Alkalibacterium sp.]